MKIKGDKSLRSRNVRDNGIVLSIVSRCLLLSSLLILMSCSTHKARWGNIQYHNTTCHYNVWWNGNESLKEGRKTLATTAVDDYTRLLPPEQLGTEENARSIYPQMDRAIEKGIKGIKKHSIYLKGVEHVPYIKECYLLTAYATFYKQDYISTVNTCNILVSQFSGTRAGDEGAVLLARCLIREKRYSEAETALDQLVNNLSQGNFSRSQRDKLYTAMVEATVPQEKYKKAVEYIHLAIESSGDSYTKARLTFLLAQIYRQLDKRPVAAKYYHQVLHYRIPYVMEFNAKLGEASCADLQHSDIRRLEKQLKDLLDDKKNKEYHDQIYFALGEMYLGFNQPRKACDNYRLSVAAATVNRAQKAQSALRLGETLYDIFQDYDHAQYYYDTVMQNIDSEYPHYHDIKRRSDILTELASYIRTYTRNDSILRIAAMPEEERLALINARIDTLRKQEQEAKEKELLAELLNEAQTQQNTLNGDWYFYNPKTVSKGKETFRQRWGMRVLEDLWFVSNKNTLSLASLFDEQQGDETEQSDATASDTLKTDLKTSNSKNGDPNDPHCVAYYLKDLPTTQQALDSIDSLTSISLLNAGYIFYDGVGNIPLSLQCYHRLADNYTSFPEIVQAFYMLYRIYDRQGNTPQANYYRDMVLMGFPDSDFANLIRDNEYYRELIRRDRRITEDYQQLYDHYTSHHYRSVIQLASEAEETYPGNPALHRFRFWHALALAQTGNRHDAIAILDSLVNSTTDNDSIHPIALAQLNFLRNDSAYLHSEDISEDEKPTTQNNKTVNVAASTQRPTTNSQPSNDQLSAESQVYRYRPNQQYYVLVLVNDRIVRATELQYRIADFNMKYYSNAGYKVNATLFTDTTQLITIHRFENEEQARNYWSHLTQDDSPLRAYSDNDVQSFFISTQNYATFYNRKKLDAYLPFFRKYHLKNK